jgi:hypothetical protein
MRKAEEGTCRQVNFGFPELIQVSHEVENVLSSASPESQRRTMIPQVLTKRVPVSSLLSFIATGRSGTLILLLLLDQNIVVVSRVN